MAKRKLFILVAGFLFVLCAIPLVFNIVSKAVIRYTTPQESFQKSGPAGAEILDILEDENAALVVYKHQNRYNYDMVIIKDAFGWPSVSVEYAETKTVNLDNGVVSYWKVQEMNVLKIVVIDTIGDYSFVLSDNCGTPVLTGCYSDDDCNVYYGLLVIEGELPNNYTLLVGDESIII